MGKAKRRGRGSASGASRRKDPHEYADAKLKGNTAIEGGDLRAAVNFYTQAAAVAPDDIALATVLSNRSLARLRAGDYQRAFEDAQECIGRRPTWSKGHFRAAEVLRATGLPEFFRPAAMYYEDAIALARAEADALAAAGSAPRRDDTRHMQRLADEMVALAELAESDAHERPRKLILGVVVGAIAGVALAVGDALSGNSRSGMVALVFLVVACAGIGGGAGWFLREQERLQRERRLSAAAAHPPAASGPPPVFSGGAGGGAQGNDGASKQHRKRGRKLRRKRAENVGKPPKLC